jgi:pimeloyl-ACP methyl ester carboxylesterase
MKRIIALSVLMFSLNALPAGAEVTPFPAGIKAQKISTNGALLNVRVGGQGPAVVLLHGYGETGDMWAPLAINLAKDHTVIVPDLRGMGLLGSSGRRLRQEESGARDRRRAGRPEDRQVSVVAHDIGNMVAYAFAAENPARVTQAGVDRRAGARASDRGKRS